MPETPNKNPENPPAETGRTAWQQFYDGHAARYLDNPFTKHTTAEVDFLLTLVRLTAEAHILDIGCGVGRHAIELAKRGYRVTGVDFSEGMLTKAIETAQSADVKVEWVAADATEYVHPVLADFAICLCEGAFNLIGAEDEPVTHDLAILRNISASLKPGAPFVLTALNGYSMIRQMTDEAVAQQSFDPLTMVATYRDTWNLPEGPTALDIRERLYIPPELSAMLYTAGFEVLACYGGSAGEWARRPLRLDEVEAMYVCRKRPNP